MSVGKSGRRAPIGEQELDTMCVFLKMMADRTRLRILTELLEGSLCVMHISERVC